MSNLTKRTGRISRKCMDVCGLEIEVLPLSGSVKYLGKKLTFEDPGGAELDNRISAGWKKFMIYKDELTKKEYSLHDRLKLLDTVVKPTVLYGAATWVMTSPMESRLQRCQRRMLRMILGRGRRRVQTNTGLGDTVEPWVDWVKRSTREAESKMDDLSMDTWVTAQRRLKWAWAQKVQQSSSNTWSRIVAEWEPQCALRSQGRPRARWSDDIQKLLSSKGIQDVWYKFAGDWSSLESDFVHRYDM